MSNPENARDLLRPMELAPHNGSWVILWYRSGLIVVPIMAHWAEVKNDDKIVASGWFTWTGTRTFQNCPPDPLGWSMRILSKEERRAVATLLDAKGKA